MNLPTEPNRNPDRLNLVMRSYDGKITAFVEHSPQGQYVLWSDYVQLRERLRAEEEISINLRLAALKDPMIVKVVEEMVKETLRLAEAKNKPNF
jgi:hypothetical protein